MATIDDVIAVSPTPLESSLLRSSLEGAFGAARPKGKTHEGIDIVANQSSADKSIYQVRSTSAGQIAYARLNGTATMGYGYTVVVDHQNGFYTLYAHLAINASSGLVSAGQQVSAGDILGYSADLANNELSSGNARKVASYDQIQLHFECFGAPPGLSSQALWNRSKMVALLTIPPVARWHLDIRYSENQLWDSPQRRVCSLDAFFPLAATIGRHQASKSTAPIIRRHSNGRPNNSPRSKRLGWR